MKYALLFNETADEVAKGTNPETADTYWGAWGAYMSAMNPHILNGTALAGVEQATTVRTLNGTRHVQDGPFADTKEMFGGFVIIDVPDLDTALDWAARAPCAAAGSVEVRPTMTAPGD
jgi:hypothetical protein